MRGGGVTYLPGTGRNPSTGFAGPPPRGKLGEEL
jgi:hypothetical protein